MTDFDAAIEKLLRRIARAISKGKWKKVDRLSKQFEQLYELQEEVETQESKSPEGTSETEHEGVREDDMNEEDYHNREEEG